MGISPGRTRPCTHRPERERERAHQRASIGRLAARDSLGKNVSKQVCFWLWGKDNLVQLPKRTHRYVNRGYSLFFWGSNGVSQVFCWRTFYRQGPIRRWICTSFNTERWSGKNTARSAVCLSCRAHRNILTILSCLVRGDSSGAGGSSCCGHGGHSSRLPTCRWYGGGRWGTLWGPLTRSHAQKKPQPPS